MFSPGIVSQSSGQMGRTPPSAAVRPQTQLSYNLTPSTKGPTEAEKKESMLLMFVLHRNDYVEFHFE
jgi:hypothetical protein